jgi:thioredoxin-related protein
MRIVVTAFLFSLTFFVVYAQNNNQNIASIAIGTEIPQADYKMEDVSGEIISLNSTKKKNGLLVIFSCNTCPYVLGWQDRYIPMGDWTLENNVGFVLVNSNEAQRNDVDALEKMREHAAKNKYNTFYVVDQNSELADAFGATRTPEVFLFDGNGTLVYKGAIDDNSEDAAAVEKPYLGLALQNLLTEVVNDPSATKSIGCTIKRLK